MASRFKSAGTIHRKEPAVIPCQHGLIYTVAPNALGALLDESASIVRQLRRIQGVTVKLIDGVMSALFPPILLTEVARVMRPLPRNESAPVPAAYRGRIR
jgi:hypothetical protein